jgi:hypothetical protein
MVRPLEVRTERLDEVSVPALCLAPLLSPQVSSPRELKTASQGVYRLLLALSETAKWH